MNPRSKRTSSIVAYQLKLCAKVEKFSARGFSFNNRVVYIDE